MKRQFFLFLCALLFWFSVFNFFLYDKISECSRDYYKCAMKTWLHTDNALKELSQQVKERYYSILEDIWTYRHSHVTPESIEKFQENVCKIPILNPFDPDMSKIFSPVKAADCRKQNHTLYFKAHVNGAGHPEILMESGIPQDVHCCYEELRFQEVFNYGRISSPGKEPCSMIKTNRTRILSDSQYIVIHCWNISNSEFTILDKSRSYPIPVKSLPPKTQKQLLIFVPKPRKSLLNRKASRLKDKSNPSDPNLNVIILGFDQISRLNFVRLMAHTYDYLKTEADAIDLQGFNKIGDATLNNTLAFLTGHDFGAISKKRSWWGPQYDFFDRLPWIWKNFSDRGYLTSYGDDQVSVFDYRFRGFRQQPTDYYLHPFIKWLHFTNATFKRFSEFLSAPTCLGNEFTLDLLQNYAVKTAQSFGNHPYFQFLWNQKVHEKPWFPSIADKGLLATLRHFETTGVLNKSLVILISDHGWRAGNFMKKSLQARIENKMSFCFLLLPQWFKTRYQKAYENLKENQFRLTTPYDIYSTMLDILDPEAKLNDGAIGNRDIVSRFMTSTTTVNQKGISLFTTIPKSRSCEMAGIDEVWCGCSQYRKFSPASEEAIKLGIFAVDTINNWLSPYPSCKKYTLGEIFSAEVKVSPQISDTEQVDLSQANTFRLVIVTDSRNKVAIGVFEVVIFTDKGWNSSRNPRDATKLTRKGLIKMSNEVFRLNFYGSSPCIRSYSLKKLCTCEVDYVFDGHV